MNRTVRNGVAIVGLAGGMWFLGQAVANAADGQTATSTAGISQDAGGSDGNTTNHNNGDATAIAANVSVTSVTSVNVGGDATNVAAINTGVISGGGGGGGGCMGDCTTLLTPTLMPPGGGNQGSTTVNGGDVHLTQNAVGGNVVNSGNVAVNNAGSQTATATAGITQNADGKDDGKASNHNNGDATAIAANIDITKVRTINIGGDATNLAFVNTGLIGDFHCRPHATCTINGGDVWLTQNAKGGDVINSGNVGINAPVPGQQPATPPQKRQEKKVAPAAKKVTPAATKAVVLSSTQPKAVLATTGAEYGVPLTLGLIALGAGAGLTAAGRRRRYSTTV